MLSFDSNTLFNKSLNYARVVSGMESIYTGFRNEVGRTVTVVIASLVALPFGLWLAKQRRSIAKVMKKGHCNFTSPGDYASYKRKMEELNKFVPALRAITQYKLEKAPILVRYSLNQMQKTSLVLLDLVDFLQKRVDAYNTPTYYTNFKSVNHISEKELWDRRSKAYEYWL